MSQSRNNPISHMAKNAEFTTLFPTQYMQVVLPGTESLNEKLRELILKHEENSKSVTHSNQGGWQSGDDIFGWGGTELQTLHGYFMNAVKMATDRLEGLSRRFEYQFRIHGWANINRKGHFNQHHVHPGATWSAVYYVDV